MSGTSFQETTCFFFAPSVVSFQRLYSPIQKLKTRNITWHRQIPFSPVAAAAETVETILSRINQQEQKSEASRNHHESLSKLISYRKLYPHSE